MMSRNGLMSLCTACALMIAGVSYPADQRVGPPTQADERFERQLPASVKLQRDAKGKPSSAQELAIAQSLTEEAASSPAALEEARTRVGRVLEQDARNMQAHMLAGRIALLDKDPRLAVSHFRAAAAARPVNAGALLGLGQSLEAAGDAEGAAAAFAEYRKAVGLAPLPENRAATTAPVPAAAEAAQKK